MNAQTKLAHADLSIQSLIASNNRRLCRAVSAIALNMVRKADAPVPLWRVAERIAFKTGIRVPPELGRLTDAVRLLLICGPQRRVRVQFATIAGGMGYVYDLKRKQTWPHQSSPSLEL